MKTTVIISSILVVIFAVYLIFFKDYNKVEKVDNRNNAETNETALKHQLADFHITKFKRGGVV